MIVKKLFEDDSYLNEFESEIISVEDDKVVLSQTAFYANSGGQPGDTGYIIYNDENIKIIDTIKGDENSVIHIMERSTDKLQKGQKIKGKIDWERRYKFMKYHTALHILSGIIAKETKAMVTGGQIGIKHSRMDFNTRSVDKEQMAQLIQQANDIISKNYDISVKKIPYEELKKNPALVRTIGVAPPDHELVRIVNISNFDEQACGGTHVKNTGEIKKIELKKLENKGKNNKRVYIIVN